MSGISWDSADTFARIDGEFLLFTRGPVMK